MSVTFVTRWSVSDMATNLDLLKRAKAIQMKHGAEVFRASQVYTGEFTGQLIVSIVYADFAAWAAVQAKATAEMQPVFAEAAKSGSVLQDRTILIGLDV